MFDEQKNKFIDEKGDQMPTASNKLIWKILFMTPNKNDDRLRFWEEGDIKKLLDIINKMFLFIHFFWKIRVSDFIFQWIYNRLTVQFNWVKVKV